MEKNQVIDFIKNQLASGNISKEDLLNISSVGLDQTQPSSISSEDSSKENSKKLMHIFYAIGAIVAVIGVCILVAQNWSEIGYGGRVFVTAGISLLSYVAAISIRNPEQSALSQVLFTISAALTPLSAYVLLGDQLSDLIIQFATASMLFLVFGAAFLAVKRNILVLLTTAFASWAYVVIVLEMFGGDANFFWIFDIIKWAMMLLGVSYILIGYGFSSLWPATSQQDEKERKSIVNVLYLFGTLMILGVGISIGGLFDLLFIGILFGAFYGSIYLKSKSMLLLGSLFLMVHILKITSKYFVGSIGWPVALMVSGFAIIGVGYFTYYFNRRFIKS